MTHMQDEFAGALSGGQRKLLEMARAMMAKPRMIMLDEPMAGVNPALTQSLLGHVKRLRSEGITVLFVEHDMDVVQDISDWVVVMAEGQVIAEGPPRSIGENAAVVDAYLGSSHAAFTEEIREVVEQEHDPDSVDPGHVKNLAGNRRRPMAELLIHVDNVIAGYVPGVNILNGANLELTQGELIGVIGPNGAGKSTMLKALFGLIKVTEGVVWYRGEDVTGKKANFLVARGIGYVPQINNVFPSLTVRENLEMGGYLRKSGVSAMIDTVIGIFPRLGERIDQRAGSLSGGERQMLAMGRALMMEPSVLLLDEPSAGLSPVLQDQVFDRVKQVNSTGVSIIMVEQNAARCLSICDRGYVLDQGRNAYTGTGERTAARPEGDRALPRHPRQGSLTAGTRGSLVPGSVRGC